MNSSDSNKGKLFVVVGPSGVGKGTILKEVFSHMKNLTFSVSATTRKKRENEIHGVNYLFKSFDDFQEMIKNNELLEWAEFVGNFYGTPQNTVLSEINAGNDVILEIEIEGAKQVKEKLPNDSIFVFIKPPSLEILKNRLVKRATDSEESIQKRLLKAEQELQEMEKSNIFEHVIINEDNCLEQSIKELTAIIKSYRSNSLIA